MGDDKIFTRTEIYDIIKETKQNATEITKLQEQIKKAKEEKPPFDWALAVRERGAKPLPTHVLIRGNAASPGPERP